MLVDKEQDRTIDKCAVYDFLSLLAVPAPNTLFQNIKKLPAGTYAAGSEFRWKDKNIDIGIFVIMPKRKWKRK